MGELKPDAVHGFPVNAKLCCIDSIFAGEQPLFREMQKTDIPLVRTGLFIALLLSAGCTANNLSENIASWQGSHIDEVASVWGAPNECEMNEGQKVCTWIDQIPAEDDAKPVVVGEALLPRPSCIRMLAVDSSGYVTGWRWRGSRCPNSISVARAQ
jgi:hypothetical protein